MINIIWFILISCGIIFSFFSNVDMSNVILNSGNEAYNLILTIGPNIVLWSGVLNIAEKSGLLKKIAILLKPFLSRIMPTCSNDKALEYVSSNVAANMMGLGSVATPAGLKAMEEFQKDNKDKTRASDAMITFLVLNTSGVTIIPMTVLSLRLMHKSINVTSIIIPGLIATLCSTTGGLLLDYFIRRRNGK